MAQLKSEHKHFLMDQVRTAKLAIVRKDGRPHVTPVWFELDGDTLVFTAWHTSVKAVNIKRDGRVCLCVDDEKPPFSYIQIEGTAVQRRAEILEHSHCCQVYGGRVGRDLWKAQWCRRRIACESYANESCLY